MIPIGKLISPFFQFNQKKKERKRSHFIYPLYKCQPKSLQEELKIYFQSKETENKKL